jgi:feruloyl-CoA synthase
VALDASASVAEILRHRAVLDRLRDLLIDWNAANPASTTRIARVLLLAEPPSIDANEITDKGYINQRAVRDRRATDVARLHAGSPDPDVIVVSQAPRKVAIS